MKVKDTKGLLTPQEVCNMLRVCKRTLSRYAEQGFIKPIKFNQRAYRYDPDDVDKLISQLKGEAN